MKQRLAAFSALMAFAGSAFAYGTYTEVNNEVETCNVYGQIGDLYYRMAEQGKRPQRHHEPYLEPVRQHIENEIYDHHDQYTQQSAANFAWSYCMDNVPRLIRDHKAMGN